MSGGDASSASPGAASAPVHLPAIADLLTHDVVAMAEAFYDCPVRVRSVRAYRNQAVEALDPDHDVHANVWHLDAELDVRPALPRLPHGGRGR